MWLAAACGTPAWSTKPGAPHSDAPTWMTKPSASIFDAPPFAGATYIGTAARGDFGHPGPQVGLEHGNMHCRRLVDVLDRQRNGDPVDPQAERECSLEVAKLLMQLKGLAVVVDASGARWLSAAELRAAAGTIDTPAKALLVVWAGGNYQLDWYDGRFGYGGPEYGLVRAVDGGFEVVGSTSTSDGNCGGRERRETVTNYRHTLFVDASGKITERERVVSNRYDVADPCHPLGRRPADFADIASGGTLRGHLLRAMHHEAESVRAFQRIARELRAHGAPGELVDAALAAADDEHDHAARFARRACAHVAIARDDLPVRSLVDFAIDNAREGCIGESYAALANVVQARTAAPALRDDFAAIAADELTHAALAHAIADWLDGGLAPDERARVDAARDAAIAELAAGAPRELGLPTGADAARLLAILQTTRLTSRPLT
jgi:hypothetical protein